MSTVEGKKQEKRRALLDAAYELFLERGTAKTSVEDITSRAKVGKGTFYLYFQDKGAVMQALLGRVSYQLLSDACLAVEQHTELPDFTAQVVFVIGFGRNIALGGVQDATGHFDLVTHDPNIYVDNRMIMDHGQLTVLEPSIYI